MSAPAPHAFLSGNGDRTGVWAQEECGAIRWGHGEAELPLGSFGRDVGPVPFWAKAEVEGGAHARCLRTGLGVPDRDPWGKRIEMGPGPTGTVQHIPAKPAAFVFFSLEASITCNSLEVIYI